MPSPMFWKRCGVSVNGDDPDPLRALAAHVRDADDAAVHAHGHAVAADAGGGHRAVRHDGGAVVRASRAEVRGARELERARPALELVQVLDARLRRLDADLAGEPPGDHARGQVGVQLAHRGHEQALLLVLLADDARPLRRPVQDVLGEHLEERALLLDDEDLLQALGELAHDPRLHREQHAHLEEADPVAAERVVVEAQLVERLAHVVVRLAAGEDAEPGPRRGHGDAVQPVLPRVAPRHLQAGQVQRALHLEAVRRDQVQVDLVREGLALVLDDGHDGHDPRRRDLGRRRLVGHVGDDLDAHPQARRARHGEPVAAQVEDVLHVAREDRGHQRVVERDLGVAGERGGLGDGVVAGQREHAAVSPHPRVVGVLEHVAGAVYAGRLAVPHAEDAVVLRPRERVHHLAAEHGRGAQVLVEAGGEHDVVLAEELPLPLEGLVEPAQRRAAIAGDERGRAQPLPAVGEMLVDRQAHQGLDARQVDVPLFLHVLGIEGELTAARGHASPLAVGGRDRTDGHMVRRDAGFRATHRDEVAVQLVLRRRRAAYFASRGTR